MSEPAPPAPEPDQAVRYGDGVDHVIDVWEGPGPTAVLVHGGYWRPATDRTHLRPMASRLRDSGWRVASIEYRRLPGQPDLAVADVRAALATVRPSVIIGHSAGGHLALCTMRGDTPVLALAPLTDLRMSAEQDLGDGAAAAFVGAAAHERPDLDPVRLPDPPAPVTVVHGTDDDRVPAAMSRSYAAAHPAVRLTTVPGAGHFELITPGTTAWPTVEHELTAIPR